jgi:SAM-dependent methyltransferase
MTLRSALPSDTRYRSETDVYRHVVLPWIPQEGNGLDIGHGGDPIVPWAATVDKGDVHMSNCGEHPTNFSGDASHLPWFTDGALDWIYSSHCLEDFEDTESVLREWLRVLRVGGRLVLLLPDQRRYVAHCIADGTEPNGAHKHGDFGLTYMEAIAARIGGLREVFRWDPGEGYNFAVAYEKI